MSRYLRFVAVLAAVAVPLMAGNVNNARSSEASASLGVIQTNLRTVLAQQSFYPAYATGSLWTTAGGVSTSKIPGIQVNDLVGRYFDDNDFSIQASAAGNPAAVPPTTGTYCIGVQWVNGPLPDANARVAPQAAQVQNSAILRSIDERGDIRNTLACTGGAAAIIN